MVATTKTSPNNNCAVFQAPVLPALKLVSVLGLCTFRDTNAEANVESAYRKGDHA